MARGKQTAAPKTPAKKAKVTKATNGGKRGKPSKTIKSKRPSIFESIMLGKYDSDVQEKPARDDPQNVLNRATAKALSCRKLQPVQQSNAETSKKLDQVEDVKPEEMTDDAGTTNATPKSALNIFHRKLPRDLREKIFKLAVVDDRHFVFPHSTTGKEQPDLAMTCKEIRKEVLDIYYAENVFALEINAVSMPIRRSMPPTEKWLKTMAKAGWLQKVQHWAFINEVLVQPVSQQGAIAIDAGLHKAVLENENLVRVVPNNTPIFEALVISFNWHRGTSTEDDGGTSTVSPCIEIHSDASCVLPLSARNHCVVQICPTWFNEIFIRAFLGRNGKMEFQPNAMMKMLKALDERSTEILGLCCANPLI